MEFKLIILVILFSALIAINADEYRHYNGYSVLRLFPTTKSQLKFLNDLANTRTDVNLKFWQLFLKE